MEENGVMMKVGEAYTLVEEVLETARNRAVWRGCGHGEAQQADLGLRGCAVAEVRRDRECENGAGRPEEGLESLGCLGFKGFATWARCSTASLAPV